MLHRNDNSPQKTDFRLVQSYIPYAQMVGRALVFAAGCLQVRSMVSGHVFLTLVFLLVYMDVLWHSALHSSVISLHLLPVAFMLTTADRQSVISIPRNVHIVLDGVWAAMCVMHYVCNSMRIHSTYIWVRLTLMLLCVLVHMPSTPYDMTQWEVYVRISAFYTLCFVHYHIFCGRVSCDSNIHTLLGPNMNLYILFAHKYVVLLALVMKCCVLCKMHFDDCRMYKRESCVGAGLSGNASITSDQEMQDLMLELRAAQQNRAYGI